MLLTIDLGNTNLTLGLYQEGKLGAHWRLSTDHTRMPDEYGIQLIGLLANAGFRASDLTGVCLSSVVPPMTQRMVQACENYLNQEPLVVDASLKTGITIGYDDPKAVGADRIADAVAVYHFYGGPACVIDFGTATTFNALTDAGEYLGGAIFPGVNVAAEALFSHAARLSTVELKRPPSVIGRNTPHAIQSGMIFGYVSLAEGMIQRFRTILGDEMKVVATGGLVEVIANETEAIQIVAPWLTLDGLRLIWEMNQ